VHLFRVHLGGPEGGPVAVGRRLEHLDQALGRLQPVLNEAHLMLLFGVSGQDVVVRPHPSDIHECRPLLAYTPAAPSGIGLGTRGGLRDIVATTLEALGTRPGDTHSFLRPLLA
jgi:phosphopentomutase